MCAAVCWCVMLRLRGNLSRCASLCVLESLCVGCPLQPNGGPAVQAADWTERSEEHQTHAN